jgi:hypothetical protein
MVRKLRNVEGTGEFLPLFPNVDALFADFTRGFTAHNAASIFYLTKTL